MFRRKQNKNSNSSRSKTSMKSWKSRWRKMAPHPLQNANRSEFQRYSNENKLGLGRFIPSDLVREKVDSGVPARGKLQFLLPPLRRSTRLCTGRSRRHLTKRSHGCQRVHIVPPLHDLSALDGNDRDEPVVV